MGQPSLVKVEHLERMDECVVSVWRRLMLLVWRGKANAVGIERSRALFAEWVKHQPGGAGFLVVVPAQRMRAPDEATLEAMKRTASSPEPRCKGAATLLEAEGFIAASVRSIMTRLHVTNGPESAANVFGTTAEAASWAARLLEDPAITPASLAEVIRLARES
jgi:hypothetical protein